MKKENGRSACFLMLFCLACNMVPTQWHICVNKNGIYLISYLFFIDVCMESSVKIFGETFFIGYVAPFQVTRQYSPLMSCFF